MVRPLLPLLLASALLAAIAAYYFGVDEPARRRQEAAAEAEGALVAVARDQVTGIELTRDGETLRLERDGGGHWWLRSPQVAPARATTVDDLLYAVTSLRTERRINVQPSELGEYGVDETSPAIHLTGEAIDTTVRLGGKAPVGYDRTYVAAGGTVAICSTTLGETVKKPVATFLRKRLFSIDRWRAARLEVADGERRWSVAKDDKGVWRLADGTRADTDRVDGWLAAIDQVEASPLTAGVPPPPAAWAEVRIFGEESGEAAAKGSAPAPSTAPAAPAAVVRIARGGDGERVAAQVGLGFWGRLGGETVAKLLPDPDQLKDRHLVHLHAFDVDRMELRDGARHLTLRHQDGTWQSDGGAAVDGKAVDDYLQALEEAEATGYLVGEQPPMEGPELSLYRGEQLLASLAFGGEGDARARHLPDGPILDLPPETHRRLLPSPRRFVATPPEASPSETLP